MSSQENLQNQQKYLLLENKEGKRVLYSPLTKRAVRVISTSSSSSSRNKGPVFAGYNDSVERFNIRNNIYDVKKSAINADDNTISFEPPHSPKLKMSLANAFESDPYFKSQINYYTQYVFGDKIKPRLVPLQVDTPITREDNDDLVDKIIGKKKRQDFLKYVAIVDRLAQIYTNCRKIYSQSFVFGTAAGWKTLALKSMTSTRKSLSFNIPEKTPIDIKPVDGYYLGRIRQNVDTFNPVFYEYNNPNVRLQSFSTEKGKEEVIELSLRGNSNMSNIPVLLPVERLIVFDRPNVGTSPNTWYYGQSSILPALSISENIRRIDEKILPELNEGQYATVGIFSVDEDSKYDIDELAEELSNSGTRIVLNAGVTYQEIKPSFDVANILGEKKDLIKSQLMTIGIPSPLFNFEEITNRSTIEIIINVWQNIRLEDERSSIKNVMWNQWYKDLMKIFFEGEELIDLALYIDLEFATKSFTPFVDKGQVLTEMHLANILTRKEVRMDIDHSPYPEEEDPPQVQQQQQQQGQAFNNSQFPQSSSNQKQAAQNIQAVSKVKRINNQKVLLQKNQQNSSSSSSSK